MMATASPHKQAQPRATHQHLNQQLLPATTTRGTSKMLLRLLPVLLQALQNPVAGRRRLPLLLLPLLLLLTSTRTSTTSSTAAAAAAASAGRAAAAAAAAAAATAAAARRTLSLPYTYYCAVLPLACPYAHCCASYYSLLRCIVNIHPVVLSLTLYT